MAQVLGVVVIGLCVYLIVVNLKDVIVKIKKLKKNKNKNDNKGGDDQTLQNK